MHGISKLLHREIKQLNTFQFQLICANVAYFKIVVMLFIFAKGTHISGF